jgi:CHAT domain-containing protein
VSLALQDVALAKEAARKANTLLERAPNEPSVDKYVLHAKTDLARTQLRMGEARAAVDTLEPARERVKRITDEFLVMEFHHALGDSYLHLAQFSAAATDYEAGIEVAENALSTLNDESKRLKWVSGAEPLYRGHTLLLLDQGKETDALELWEWYGGRSQKEERAAGKTSWEQLQRQIFNPLPVSLSETHLVFAAFDDRLQIWAVDRDKIKGHSVKIKWEKLEQQVADFVRECSTDPAQNSNQSDLHIASQMLGSLFLDPIASELSPSEPVVIELDQRLSKLPVVALALANGHYFGEDHAVIVSPAMAVEKRLRPSLPMERALPLLVAQGAGHLPGQEDLIATVGKVFPKSAILTGEKSSWSTVKGTLRNSEAFVFIGHGMRDGLSTALIFDGKRITPKDFPPQLLKHLKLAVLEACSSGAGENPGFLDTTNLVHPFLTAGVPSVISSRWDVDSQVTSEFMAVFFQHLGRGETALQAMFHARNAALRAHSHPYYWAGLDLAGRAN